MDDLHDLAALARGYPSRDPAIAERRIGRKTVLAHPLLQRHAIHLLDGDGSNRYSVGSFVFMIGVITPFT